MTSDDGSSNGAPASQGWLRRLSLAGLLRRFARSEPKNKEQLAELLQQAEGRGLLDRDALGMMEAVLQVADLRVGDIMIPRAEMVRIRRDDPLERILAIAVDSAHSRFPVTGDDKGEVVGILLAKDLLSYCAEANRRSFNIRDHVRPAIFVPESKRLNVLLKEFRASRNHMAIVVDEYGSAAGLVTIEDVLEQIVGDIEDEHDFDEGAFIYKRGQGEYTVKARTSVEEFNDYFGCALDGGDLDTMGGLVVHALAHLPARGERVEIGGFRFTILRADSRRVHLLTVRPPAHPEAPPPDDSARSAATASS
ncbi:HlyC/CorC family transporter [Halochromatium salexigens]|uniref:Magnesium and cobalt efflux protein CorC n=1 Tax=Halochromatium salexigens TaxID=49447 RepID=A0AAJ0XH12_HALSE|nr:transporter associated domain-containing protein [Halochromatium salexigens]MBK5931217.1 magnesium/cobalt efflux protein [Halochromatium salexigens]